MCNICQKSFKKITEKDQIDHIKKRHNEIYDLHCKFPNENVAFKIEFMSEDIAKDQEQLVFEGIPVLIETYDKENKRTENTQDNSETNLMKIELKEKQNINAKEDSRVVTKRRTSWVWDYFQGMSNTIFKCTLCNVMLSIKGSNTNNMNRHFKARHPLIYKVESGKASTDGKSEQDDLTDVASESGVSESFVVDIPAKVKSNETVQNLKPCKSKMKRSWVWRYFEHLNQKEAKCSLCNRNITHGGAATGNMNRHLKMLHSEVYDSIVGEKKSSTSSMPQLVAQLPGNDMAEVVTLVQSSEVLESKSLKELEWIWKLMANNSGAYYCRICHFKCLRYNDIAQTAASILSHLKAEHGIVSSDQIISGNVEQECTIAVIESLF